jgi:hypothetical protein
MVHLVGFYYKKFKIRQTNISVLQLLYILQKVDVIGT